MKEDHLRNIAADQMAQSFLLEILLIRYIKTHPRELWPDLSETLIQAAQRTDHFAGITTNDEEAEIFADVVVKMHESIEHYVKRAVARAVATSPQTQPA